MTLPMDQMIAPGERHSSEEEWISRAKAGDCSAFDDLCRLHGDRLLWQAVRVCPDIATAEDLVQETLIAAWRSLPRYDGRCQFYTWLCGILLNRLKTVRRRRWWKDALHLFRTEPIAGGKLEENAMESSPATSEGLDVEEIQRLHDHLSRLSPKHREVIELRFFAEESLTGIAAATGTSLGTVKSRLHHALEQLRRWKHI